mgnify:FL=1
MRKNAQKSEKNEKNYLKNFINYLEESFDYQQLEKIARETGFIKRSGKIGAFNFLTCLLFNEQEQKNTSLLNIKLDFLQQHDCSVSRVAIHKRFNNEAVEFMKALLSRHVVKRFCPDIELSAKFNSISIKDSSKFRIPKSLREYYPSYNGIGKEQALMNLQYEFDLLTGNWKRFELTKATRNDQEDSKTTLDNIHQDDLLLRDLGYITMTYLKGVVKNQAYYINRLPSAMNVYYKENDQIKKLEWAEIDKRMKQGGFDQLELNVYLGKKEMLPTRLIIQPVPEEVYKDRIRKTTKHTKSKGCQVSNEYKIRAHYNMFITNTSKEQLNAWEVVKLYSLRWQIELVFKTWKSNMKIHLTKKVKKERFECQLIAKILWVVINWRLFQIANHIIRTTNRAAGCSVIKFFKQAIKWTSSLRNLILEKNDIKEWFNNVFKPLVPNLIIENKKGKKTHYQIYSELLCC